MKLSRMIGVVFFPSLALLISTDLIGAAAVKDPGSSMSDYCWRQSPYCKKVYDPKKAMTVCKGTCKDCGSGWTCVETVDDTMADSTKTKCMCSKAKARKPVKPGTPAARSLTDSDSEEACSTGLDPSPMALPDVAPPLLE